MKSLFRGMIQAVNTFDFIIIGAGSAGSVLANRLSENGRYTVLVLEAGGSDNRFWIQTPIGYGKTFYDPAVNWCYATEEQSQLNGKKSYWPRGKVMGGSSSINAMVYIRGQHDDYNDWRDMGNPEWGWDRVLPYFIKSETNSRGGDAFRGDSGPLYVNDSSASYHPTCKTFIESAKEYGLKPNPDFNGVTQEGVGMYQITTRNGLRMSAAKAYLHPALARTNCNIELNSQVTRILFDNKKATGAEYLQNREIKHVHASREVIVCAGAVNSPQLLQLSGIGPGELLSHHQIDVVLHNPQVGRNLQDHLALTHFYRSTVPTLNNQLYPWWGKLYAGLKYVLFRKGPLSLSVNQAGGFIKSHHRRARPNLQLYFAALTYITSPKGERPLMHPDPWPAFQNGVCQCRPTSRGTISIASPDPLEHPKINPNYLSTEQDMLEMIEGFHFLRGMAKTPALGKIIESEILPGESIQSESQIIEDIKDRSETVFHPTSTCMMGPDPRSSVVDQSLRVHQIQNLRVVDASVFPTVISGNINGPVIMVAEKAADIILRDTG